MKIVGFLQKNLVKNWNNQDRWTATICESDISIIKILYQCRPDIGEFSNLQLILELRLYEYKVPEIVVLTPNGRVSINEPICLDTIVDLKSPDLTLERIVEQFMCVFLDRSSFINNEQLIKEKTQTSQQWNCNMYPELFDQYNQQCENLLCRSLKFTKLS